MKFDVKSKSINISCKIFYIIIVSTITLDKTESCRGGSLISTGIKAAQISEVLEAHNRLRSQVAQGQVSGQPSAQNMREMVWDEELAAKAQQWANQCTFEHDPSRYLDRFTMGQNLAIIWSTASLGENEGSFSSRIQNWFNEVQKYAWGSRWTAKTGHYSQLVWGETNLVGCGFSYYKDARRFNKLYVCNYGPGGNVVGVAPYAVGSPSCSIHGMYPSSRYSGLCVGTQTVFTPSNGVITQNTYTFKSERINPTVYRSYNTAPNYNYHAYKQTQQNTAIQTYQQALQAYRNPNQSYESAQQNYQLALQAYSAAYSAPHTTSSHTFHQLSNNYDWNTYFG